MINRDIIRTKVVQLVYAYYQNGGNNINTAEKEFFFSLDKAYVLYNMMIDLIAAVTREAQRRLTIEQQSARRQGKPEPKDKFAINRFALQIEENLQLRDFMGGQKLQWNDVPEVVAHLLDQIQQSTIYREYMDSEEDSYAADRELWRRLYRALIENNDELDQLLEEQSLYWNDDKEIVDTFVLKTIKRFNENDGADAPLLPQFDSDEDSDYARRLFRAALLNAEEYQRMMSEASHNWDFSRLAYMDIIIMQIAIAEMFTFPSIPLTVTINEYVDLAKLYSTPQSGRYINGMLDTIARHLVKTGKLMKHMPERPQRSQRTRKEAPAGDNAPQPEAQQEESEGTKD